MKKKFVKRKNETYEDFIKRIYNFKEKINFNYYGVMYYNKNKVVISYNIGG